MTQPWKPFCPDNVDKICEEMKQAYVEGRPANYLPDKYRDNPEALLIIGKLYAAMADATSKRLYEVLKNEMPQEEVFRDSIRSIEANMHERVDNSESGHECEKEGLRSIVLGVANLLDCMSVDSDAESLGTPHLLEEVNLASARLRRKVRQLGCGG